VLQSPVGGMRTGQTPKKLKDLSVREGEVCGRWEGGGVYGVCQCDQVI
jgi:hypothetical protein